MVVDRAWCALSLYMILGLSCGERQLPGDAREDLGVAVDMAALLDQPQEVLDARPALDLGQDLGVVWDMRVDAPQDMAKDAGVDMAPMPEPEPEPEPEPARCDPLPRVCTGLDPGATEHRIKRLGDGCAFALKRSSAASIASARALADRVAALNGGYVSLDRVNLNRVAQPGLTSNADERLKNHDRFGFRWNAGDMATTDWYPQGITGQSDAVSSGGRRRLLVSWYDHDEAAPEKGVRLSLVDLSDTSNIRYRHLLLVTPKEVNGQATFGPVVTGSGGSLHAGGIVWFGSLLYVADTTQGFRVFDLSKIIEVTHTDDTSRIGVSGQRVDAHGYRYIVPQIGRYQLAPGSCGVRFSFVSLDRSTSTPTLMSGEYRADSTGGRLARWPVDPQTGWLRLEADGLVYATSAFVGGQTRMQGAMSWGDTIYMSCSSQYDGYGRLYRTKVGQTSAISAWVRGAEDLYYERATDRVWTAAEHPALRDVVSIKRPKL